MEKVKTDVVEVPGKRILRSETRLRISASLSLGSPEN
jgi:hypothetical protein